MEVTFQRIEMKENIIWLIWDLQEKQQEFAYRHLREGRYAFVGGDAVDRMNYYAKTLFAQLFDGKDKRRYVWIMKNRFCSYFFCRLKRKDWKIITFRIRPRLRSYL